MSGDHNMNQKPVAWADMDVRGEDKGLSWTPGQFHTQPLYTAPQSTNDFKPDWDTVKAYDDKFAEMLDEQQRLIAELKRTEQRLHDVATLCANLEAQAAIVDCPRCGHCCPQRHPLTDEQIDAVMPYCHNEFDLHEFRSFARSIEAAHGIGERK